MPSGEEYLASAVLLFRKRSAPAVQRIGGGGSRAVQLAELGQRLREQLHQGQG